LLTRQAFHHLLGFELVRTHRDGVTIQCRVRADLLNRAGSLHGGVTASIAGAAVGTTLYHRLEVDLSDHQRRNVGVALVTHMPLDPPKAP
jgi:acyl-coenzyme A thioesterase PaaI-like protein